MEDFPTTRMQMLCQLPSPGIAQNPAVLVALSLSALWAQSGLRSHLFLALADSKFSLPLDPPLPA